ncbi:MAG: lactoylglutathione lyase [Flavobacteriales bacterium]|nr:lactoylglutathione lyase [Flavobacteriales bacterium]
MQTQFILFVSNQEKSKSFYSALLNQNPTLHVPGMTEFELSKQVKLGLMPENGIHKIIGNTAPHPNLGNGIPRCELYLKVKNAQSFINRGIAHGATLISKLQQRTWGDVVGYILDPDGHVVAFVEE